MPTTQEIDRELLEGFWKEYYNPDFLDGKVSPANENVSVIVPTYNRAPYDPETDKSEYNPLAWALDSLLQQSGVNLSEIIIVDDNSEDHTRRVVEGFRRKGEKRETDIVYLRNPERRHPSISRNIGIEASASELLYIVDDDFVFSPYAIWGGVYSLFYLKNNGINVAGINLPLYNRSTKPRIIKPKYGIGRIDFDACRAYGDFDAFPSEYVDDAEFIDQDMRILRPIEIQHFNQNMVFLKEPVENIGGFPPWPEYVFAEQLEMACRLLENGYRLFFSPDPKFHAVHLRYAYDYCPSEAKAFTDGMYDGKITLGEMIRESKIPRLNSGCRVPDTEWGYTKILRVFSIFSRYNERAGEILYREFVERNTFGDGYDTRIDERAERERIFNLAVTNALEPQRALT